jgi:hypothetical protein
LLLQLFSEAFHCASSPSLLRDLILLLNFFRTSLTQFSKSSSIFFRAFKHEKHGKLFGKYILERSRNRCFKKLLLSLLSLLVLQNSLNSRLHLTYCKAPRSSSSAFHCTCPTKRSFPSHNICSSVFLPLACLWSESEPRCYWNALWQHSSS